MHSFASENNYYYFAKNNNFKNETGVCEWKYNPEGHFIHCLFLKQKVNSIEKQNIGILYACYMKWNLI